GWGFLRCRGPGQLTNAVSEHRLRASSRARRNGEGRSRLVDRSGELTRITSALGVRVERQLERRGHLGGNTWREVCELRTVNRYGRRLAGQGVPTEGTHRIHIGT